LSHGFLLRLLPHSFHDWREQGSRRVNDHPNLKRWMADIEQLPCWEKTQAAVERALRLERSMFRVVAAAE
jgi:hypothetical protein